MAELNELTVRNDTLIQGDATVNGKLNGVENIYDDNTILINICKRIDVSSTGTKLNIKIPTGYVASCINGDSINVLGWKTYGSNVTAWTTSAVLTVSTVRADNSQTTSNTTEIGNYSNGQMSCGVPFAKSYVKIDVTTAATGATKPYCCIYGQIVLHKE